ncbi:hypothetical protein PSEUDO8Z_120039 [Pseudomonas sp. 8Z]|uniref:hypothetical protein n=1 Tax=Pseudomonas sp. 8Z TaxID=2653166 RepID=UPI0012EEF5D1|nr:hypothetical protein [Pseudomonas sp. 8Z]VXC49618.1 hypothetical protein PSEUDO8Z_120039 [Pseudomonas sp. 8Z]
MGVVLYGYEPVRIVRLVLPEQKRRQFSLLCRYVANQLDALVLRGVFSASDALFSDQWDKKGHNLVRGYSAGGISEVLSCV